MELLGELEKKLLSGSRWISEKFSFFPFIWCKFEKGRKISLSSSADVWVGQLSVFLFRKSYRSLRRELFAIARNRKSIMEIIFLPLSHCRKREDRRAKKMCEREERVKIRNFSTFCFFLHSHSYKKCENSFAERRRKTENSSIVSFSCVLIFTWCVIMRKQSKIFCKEKSSLYSHFCQTLTESSYHAHVIIKCFSMMLRANSKKRILLWLRRFRCTSVEHVRQGKLLIEMKRVESWEWERDASSWRLWAKL